MALQLFAHNQEAYEAAVELLAETSKAAIIHPTGTGKSFIGFRLCADHPNERVCWLSPSEYIFKTQIENLAAVADGYEPNNIQFFTYAKLMSLSEEELATMKPDYIILDEFHRCGAEMWGEGVDNLLSLYPDTPLLGLSATHIRYLDNQRNMAEELFDGNIASEMTLGEAIVRGILLPPVYVMSVYSYQQELQQYQKRVKRAKSKAVRDTAEQTLDALRRALEHAEGLDQVFLKHMTDKHGKYIVFCANVEHMNEMISHVPEWFSQVDAEPQVYRAYAEDPTTSQAFQTFKEDQSKHLKLLFCIDMLNEGVHVEDVSGVILFRPTVSPIIYKQQLGRALSASKHKQPVVFDIVNNFEGLYGIDTVKEEVRAAINYYHLTGENRLQITERFQIIDEIRNCRELFDTLNDTLTAPWDNMYAFAKKYYQEHGNLDIPKRFKTAEGYTLGNWIYVQRRVRAGLSFGKLTQAQIEKLDALGMIWENRFDVSWDRNFAEAKAYFIENGHLQVPAAYKTEDGFALGTWISRMRLYRKSNIRSSFLTQERIKALDELQMVWDVADYYWEQNYLAVQEYCLKHGDINIPMTHKNKAGLAIGQWLCRIRAVQDGTAKGVALTTEQIARLNMLGMVWENKSAQQWQSGYAQAKKYYDKHGDLNVPTTYKSENGFALGQWLERHRADEMGRTRIKVTSERKAKLDKLGMIWVKEDPWNVRFELVKVYFAEHGDLNIPQDYVTQGIWLGKWLYEQRRYGRGKVRNKVLTTEQKRLLENVGMDWRTPAERAWDDKYALAGQYFRQHGHLNVPAAYRAADGSDLFSWMKRQKILYRKGLLSKEQIIRLSVLGIDWITIKHTVAMNRNVVPQHRI